MRKSFGLVVLAAVAASLAAPSSAKAAVTCATDDFGRPGVSVTGHEYVALKVIAGVISYDPGFQGDGFISCGATVTSTDTIFVVGEAGTAQGLIIDLSGGPFGPGFSTFDGPVPENIPEIEWSVDLRGGGGYVPDVAWVKGTDAADRLRAAGFGTGGLNGVTRGLELNWFADGPLGPDTDLDVVFPGAVPEMIKLLGERGPDSLTGRTVGFEGADPAYLLQFDGGPGDDYISGTDRTNTHARCKRQTLLVIPTFDTAARDRRWECLVGGTGEDRLFGEDGMDKLMGEDGRDRLRGGAGDDFLHGGDGEDDCGTGPGRDTERDCES